MQCQVSAQARPGPAHPQRTTSHFSSPAPPSCCALWSMNSATPASSPCSGAASTPAARPCCASSSRRCAAPPSSGRLARAAGRIRVCARQPLAPALFQGSERWTECWWLVQTCCGIRLLRMPHHICVAAPAVAASSVLCFSEKLLQLTPSATYLEGECAAGGVVARLCQGQKRGGWTAGVVSRLEHSSRAVEPRPGRRHEHAASAAVCKVACAEQSAASAGSSASM